MSPAGVQNRPVRVSGGRWFSRPRYGFSIVLHAERTDCLLIDGSPENCLFPLPARLRTLILRPVRSAPARCGAPRNSAQLSGGQESLLPPLRCCVWQLLAHLPPARPLPCRAKRHCWLLSRTSSISLLPDFSSRRVHGSSPCSCSQFIW